MSSIIDDDYTHEIVNTLLDDGSMSMEVVKKGSKSSVNANEPLFEAIPNKLVFSDYEGYKEYSMSISVRNKDSVARRVRLEQPENSHFSLELSKECGLTHASKIAPGMSLKYTVKFLPHARKEYNTNIICISERESFFIPCLALAEIPEVDIPKEVDTGRLPVNYDTMVPVLLRNQSSIDCVYSVQCGEFVSITEPIGQLTKHGVLQQKLTVKVPTIGAYNTYVDVVVNNIVTKRVSISGVSYSLDIVLDTTTIAAPATYLNVTSQKVIKLYNKSDRVVKYKFYTYASDTVEAGVHQILLDEQLQREAEELQQVEEEHQFASEEAFSDLKKLMALQSVRAGVMERYNAEKLKITQDMEFASDCFRQSPLEGEQYGNQFHELSLQFTPETPVAYKAVAYLECEGVKGRVPVRLQGLGIGPKVVLEYTQLDVGTVFIHAVNHYSLRMTNTGGVPAKFSIPADSQRVKFLTRAGELPVCLPTEEPVSIILDLDFASHKVGAFEEVVPIYLEGALEPVLFTVKGEIVGPTFTIEPAELDFQDVAYGFVTRQTLTITNTALVPMKYRLRVPQDELRAVYTKDGSKPISGAMLMDSTMSAASQALGAPEFHLSPALETLLPKQKQVVTVDFLTHSIANYSGTVLPVGSAEPGQGDPSGTVVSVPYLPKGTTEPYKLTVDILGVGDAVKSIPIRAVSKIMVPVVLADTLNFPSTFLEHPTTLSQSIRNDHDLDAKIEVLPQDSNSLSVVTVSTDLAALPIPPNTLANQPITVIPHQLGEFSLPLYIRFPGCAAPPVHVLIQGKSHGPSVTASKSTINFGVIPVLKPYAMVLTLTNTSPIPANYKAIMRKAGSAYSVDIPVGVIPPRKTITLTVTACVNETAWLNDTQIIVIQNSKELNIAIKAKGDGTTLQPSMNLNVIDHNHVFTHHTTTRTFRITNRGRRTQILSWVKVPSAAEIASAEQAMLSNGRTGRSVAPESDEEEELPGKNGPEEMDKQMKQKMKAQAEFLPSAFTISPAKVTLPPDTAMDFTVTGSCMTAGVVREKWVCKSSLSGSGTSNQTVDAFTTKVKCSFVDPKVDFTEPELRFQSLVEPGVEQPPLSRNVVLSNPTPQPLSFVLKCPFPFTCDLSTVELQPQECQRATVQFDPTCKEDRVSADVQALLVAQFNDHSATSSLPLAAQISFPNLDFSHSTIDLGCVNNHAAKRVVAVQRNKSPQPAKFNWNILESSPSVSIAQPFVCTTVVENEVVSIAPSKVINIAPMTGVIMPNEEQLVEFIFYSGEATIARAVAQCAVEGGPTYEFPVLGESSQASYRIDKTNVQFGACMFSSVNNAEVTITNTGRVPLDFVLDTSSLSTLGTKQFTFSHSSIQLQTGQKVKLQIQFHSLVPVQVTEIIRVCLGYYDPVLVHITALGVYPTLLADLPRIIDITAPTRSVAENLIQERLQAAMDANEVAIQSVLNSNGVHEDVIVSTTAPMKRSKKQSNPNVPLLPISGGERELPSEYTLPQVAQPYTQLALIGLEQERLDLVNLLQTAVLRDEEIKMDQHTVGVYDLTLGHLVLGKGKKKTFLQRNPTNSILTVDVNKEIFHKTVYTVEPTSFKIAPGASQQVTVSCATQLLGGSRKAPSLESILTAQTLGIPFYIHGCGVIKVNVSANVTLPSFTPSTGNINFDTVYIGTRKECYVQFVNDKPVPCEWSFAGISGLSQKEKNIIDIFPSNGTLQPGAHVNVCISYTPTLPSQLASIMTFKVSLNAAPIVLKLRGEAKHYEIAVKTMTPESIVIQPYELATPSTLSFVNNSVVSVELTCHETDTSCIEEDNVLREDDGYNEHGYQQIYPPRTPGDQLPLSVLTRYHIRKLAGAKAIVRAKEHSLRLEKVKQAVLDELLIEGIVPEETHERVIAALNTESDIIEKEEQVLNQDMQTVNVPVNVLFIGTPFAGASQLIKSLLDTTYTHITPNTSNNTVYNLFSKLTMENVVNLDAVVSHYFNLDVEAEELSKEKSLREKEKKRSWDNKRESSNATVGNRRASVVRKHGKDVSIVEPEEDAESMFFAAHSIHDLTLATEVRQCILKFKYGEIDDTKKNSSNLVRKSEDSEDLLTDKVEYALHVQQGGEQILSKELLISLLIGYITRECKDQLLNGVIFDGLNNSFVDDIHAVEIVQTAMKRLGLLKYNAMHNIVLSIPGEEAKRRAMNEFEECRQIVLDKEITALVKRWKPLPEKEVAKVTEDKRKKYEDQILLVLQRRKAERALKRLLYIDLPRMQRYYSLPVADLAPLNQAITEVLVSSGVVAQKDKKSKTMSLDSDSVVEESVLLLDSAPSTEYLVELLRVAGVLDVESISHPDLAEYYAFLASTATAPPTPIVTEEPKKKKPLNSKKSVLALAPVVSVADTAPAVVAVEPIWANYTRELTPAKSWMKFSLHTGLTPSSTLCNYAYDFLTKPFVVPFILQTPEPAYIPAARTQQLIYTPPMSQAASLSKHFHLLSLAGEPIQRFIQEPNSTTELQLLFAATEVGEYNQRVHFQPIHGIPVISTELKGFCTLPQIDTVAENMLPKNLIEATAFANPTEMPANAVYPILYTKLPRYKQYSVGSNVLSFGPLLLGANRDLLIAEDSLDTIADCEKQFLVTRDDQSVLTNSQQYAAQVAQTILTGLTGYVGKGTKNASANVSANAKLSNNSSRKGKKGFENVQVQSVIQISSVIPPALLSRFTESTVTAAIQEIVSKIQNSASNASAALLQSIPAALQEVMRVYTRGLDAESIDPFGLVCPGHATSNRYRIYAAYLQMAHWKKATARPTAPMQQTDLPVVNNTNVDEYMSVVGLGNYNGQLPKIFTTESGVSIQDPLQFFPKTPVAKKRPIGDRMNATSTSAVEASPVSRTPSAGGVTNAVRRSQLVKQLYSQTFTLRNPGQFDAQVSCYLRYRVNSNGACNVATDTTETEKKSKKNNTSRAKVVSGKEDVLLYARVKPPTKTKVSDIEQNTTGSKRTSTTSATANARKAKSNEQKFDRQNDEEARMETLSADDVFSVDTPNVLIPAGGEAQVTVWAFPQGFGSYYDELVLCVHDNPIPCIVPLVCTGEEPRLALSPPDISFGKVILGTSRTAGTVISNPTDTPLAWCLRQHHLMTASNAWTCNVTSGVLLPGQRDTITFTLDASALCAHEWKVEIDVHDLTGLRGVLDTHVLHITAQVVKVEVSVGTNSDPGVDFGTVCAGQTAQQQVLVTNNGREPIQFHLQFNNTGNSNVNKLSNSVVLAPDTGKLNPGASIPITLTLKCNEANVFVLDETLEMTVADIDSPLADNVIPLVSKIPVSAVISTSMVRVNPSGGICFDPIEATTSHTLSFRLANEGVFPAQVHVFPADANHPLSRANFQLKATQMNEAKALSTPTANSLSSGGQGNSLKSSNKKAAPVARKVPRRPGAPGLADKSESNDSFDSLTVGCFTISPCVHYIEAGAFVDVTVVLSGNDTGSFAEVIELSISEAALPLMNCISVVTATCVQQIKTYELIGEICSQGLETTDVYSIFDEVDIVSSLADVSKNGDVYAIKENILTFSPVTIGGSLSAVEDIEVTRSKSTTHRKRDSSGKHDPVEPAMKSIWRSEEHRVRISNPHKVPCTAQLRLWNSVEMYQQYTSLLDNSSGNPAIINASTNNSANNALGKDDKSSKMAVKTNKSGKGASINGANGSLSSVQALLQQAVESDGVSPFSLSHSSISLGPHQHTYVTLTFTPMQCKQYDAVFEAVLVPQSSNTTNAIPSSKQNTLNCQLRGWGTVPMVTVDSALGIDMDTGSYVLQYPSIYLGPEHGVMMEPVVPHTMTVTVRNHGMLPAVMQASIQNKTESSFFTLLGGSQDFIRLLPNEEQVLQIQFFPSRVGMHTSTLKISVEDNPFDVITVSLSGEAVLRDVVLSGVDLVRFNGDAAALNNALEAKTSSQSKKVRDTTKEDIKEEFYIGDLEVDSEFTRQVTVYNHCNSAVRWRFYAPGEEDEDKKRSGKTEAPMEWTITPNVGHLPEYQSTVVTVTYRSSDRKSLHAHPAIRFLAQRVKYVDAKASSPATSRRVVGAPPAPVSVPTPWWTVCHPHQIVWDSTMFQARTVAVSAAVAVDDANKSKSRRSLNGKATLEQPTLTSSTITLGPVDDKNNVVVAEPLPEPHYTLQDDETPGKKSKLSSTSTVCDYMLGVTVCVDVPSIQCDIDATQVVAFANTYMLQERSWSFTCTNTSNISVPYRFTSDSNAFGISPESGAIAAGQTQKFVVSFAPQDASPYMGTLFSTSPFPSIQCKGTGLRPFVHVALPPSKYLASRSSKAFTLPYDCAVFEMNTVGVNRTTQHSFTVVNTSEQPLSFIWSHNNSSVCCMDHKDNTSNVICETVAGTILAGRSHMMTFSYSPTDLNALEHLFTLTFPQVEQTLPVLVVASSREAKVTLNQARVELGMTLLSASKKQIITLTNEEDMSLPWEAFIDEPEYSMCLSVTPHRGVLAPHATESFTLRYKPDTDGQVHSNLRIVVPQRYAPIMLPVRAKCNAVKTKVDVLVQSTATTEQDSHHVYTMEPSVPENKHYVNTLDFGSVLLGDVATATFTVSSDSPLPISFNWSYPAHLQPPSANKLHLPNSAVTRGTAAFRPPHKTDSTVAKKTDKTISAGDMVFIPPVSIETVPMQGVLAKNGVQTCTLRFTPKEMFTLYPIVAQLSVGDKTYLVKISANVHRYDMVLSQSQLDFGAHILLPDVTTHVSGQYKPVLGDANIKELVLTNNGNNSVSVTPQVPVWGESCATSMEGEQFFLVPPVSVNSPMVPGHPMTISIAPQSEIVLHFFFRATTPCKLNKTVQISVGGLYTLPLHLTATASPLLLAAPGTPPALRAVLTPLALSFKTVDSGNVITKQGTFMNYGTQTLRMELDLVLSTQSQLIMNAVQITAIVSSTATNTPTSSSPTASSSNTQPKRLTGLLPPLTSKSKVEKFNLGDVVVIPPNHVFTCTIVYSPVSALPPFDATVQLIPAPVPFASIIAMLRPIQTPLSIITFSGAASLGSVLLTTTRFPFHALLPGSSMSLSTTLSNHTQKALPFEWTGLNSCFEILPRNGVLQPSQAITVTVTASCPTNLTNSQENYISLEPIAPCHPKLLIDKKTCFQQNITATVLQMAPSALFALLLHKLGNTLTTAPLPSLPALPRVDDDIRQVVVANGVDNSLNPCFSSNFSTSNALYFVDHVFIQSLGMSIVSGSQQSITITIHNPTHIAWTLHPYHSNVYFDVPLRVEVPAKGNATVQVIYAPVIPTLPDQPHLDALTFTLPTGKTLVYLLVGESLHMAPIPHSCTVLTHTPAVHSLPVQLNHFSGKVVLPALSSRVILEETVTTTSTPSTTATKGKKTKGAAEPVAQSQIKSVVQKGISILSSAEHGLYVSLPSTLNLTKAQEAINLNVLGCKPGVYNQTVLLYEENDPRYKITYNVTVHVHVPGSIAQFPSLTAPSSELVSSQEGSFPAQQGGHSIILPVSNSTTIPMIINGFQCSNSMLTLSTMQPLTLAPGLSSSITLNNANYLQGFTSTYMALTVEGMAPIFYTLPGKQGQFGSNQDKGNTISLPDVKVSTSLSNTATISVHVPLSPHPISSFTCSIQTTAGNSFILNHDAVVLNTNNTTVSIIYDPCEANLHHAVLTLTADKSPLRYICDITAECTPPSTIGPILLVSATPNLAGCDATAVIKLRNPLATQATYIATSEFSVSKKVEKAAPKSEITFIVGRPNNMKQSTNKLTIVCAETKQVYTYLLQVSP